MSEHQHEYDWECKKKEIKWGELLRLFRFSLWMDGIKQHHVASVNQKVYEGVCECGDKKIKNGEQSVTLHREDYRVPTSILLL